MKPVFYIPVLTVLVLAGCAPTLVKLTPFPTPTDIIPSATEIPTPTETPVPQLNVAPEVKVVLDAQKASYKVEASGKAVITVEGKEVVLESLVDTKTDFGLAGDIINGRDKEGIRYILTEKGWIKDIDISVTTPENRIMVPFGWTTKNAAEKTTVLNIITALHYSENPTISPDAKDPPYWIRLRGSPYLIPIISLRPYDVGVEEAKFYVNQKTFSWSGFFETTTPEGNNIVILAQTRKNPTPENKKQLINLFFGFDGETYAYHIKRNNDPNVYPKGYINNAEMLQIINEDLTELVPVIPPPEDTGGVYMPFGPDFSFNKSPPNPNVVKLHKPGELFSLFSQSQQSDLRKFFVDSHNKIGDWEFRIPFIPEGFANQILFPGIDVWGPYRPRPIPD